MPRLSRIHPEVLRAFDVIDAAVLSGDTFLDERNRSGLIDYINRWQTHLATNPETFEEGCVICENEGPHDVEDRRHVQAGTE